MLDVTFFVANNFSHARDSPEMQFLLDEHYQDYLVKHSGFFYNANAQSPEDHMIQCLYHVSTTSFDLQIKPVIQTNLPAQYYSGFQVVSNDLETYRDLGLVVSTLMLQ